MDRQTRGRLVGELHGFRPRKLHHERLGRAHDGSGPRRFRLPARVARARGGLAPAALQCHAGSRVPRDRRLRIRNRRQRVRGPLVPRGLRPVHASRHSRGAAVLLSRRYLEGVRCQRPRLAREEFHLGSHVRFERPHLGGPRRSRCVRRTPDVLRRCRERLPCGRVTNLVSDGFKASERNAHPSARDYGYGEWGSSTRSAAPAVTSSTGTWSATRAMSRIAPAWGSRSPGTTRTRRPSACSTLA